MLHYDDGAEIQIGDHVDFDGTPALVYDVIDSAEKLKEWGLDEYGVMFQAREYGLVYEARDNSCWDAILLVRRSRPSRRLP
jgi:hypothetical protein